MGHPVVRKDDQIKTPPPQGAFWVLPFVFVQLDGSGGFTVGGKSVCLPNDIEGLEQSTSYYTATYSAVHGNGKIQFTLAAGHRAAKTKTKGQPVVVNDGTPLTYRFRVERPAQDPMDVPDSVLMYTGTATFQCVTMPKPVTAG